VSDHLGPLAFYAPLKSPNHGAPSGDRTMARLLMKVLERAGFAPRLASEIRTFDGAGDADVQAAIRDASLAEADRLVETWARLPRARRPRLWFTYHLYYKAPDWIGPRVADALQIPYVLAEASRAMKRATGPWALGHAAAEAALERADLVFVVTHADREALEPWASARRTLVDLPPFVDLDAWPKRQGHRRVVDDTPRLLTVAMMRAGDKLASYRILADALVRISALSWQLDVVGDGEARCEVERLLATFEGRVVFHGELNSGAILADLYERADLLVWPAVNEAYGMALLEAQAFGCPVVAGAYGGVPAVVRDGETGLLTAPGDPQALAAAVATLLRDPTRRQRLGDNGRNTVRQARNIDAAAKRLRAALLPLVAAEVAVP
jgi:glycosyltransferase involved in cell wall biosynthesis